MDRKYIIRALRPLKGKIYLHKAIKVFLWALIISGSVSLVLAVVSLFAVIPFVRYKMLVVTAAGLIAALLASLFFIPDTRKLIMTADSLGLNERVITAWYFMDDNSEVAELQRQDARRALESTNLVSAYRMKIDKKLYILASCIITAAFLLTFMPGRISDETRIRESLIQKINENEKKIEEEINAQEQKNPGISEEQLNQLKEALEKLKEELKKSKSEEDALKALSKMENLIDKLKQQDPLRDLNTLQNTLGEMLFTKDMAQALKNKDDGALQEAIENLMKELEDEQKLTEFTEILKQAAMNIGDSSMLAEALQDLASAAGSENLSGSELVQSLVELIKETEMNAEGQQNFENALADIGDVLEQARRSISEVDQRVALGNTAGWQGQSGNTGNGSNQQGGSQIPGNGSRSGQENTNGGMNGSKSHVEGGGPGAGEGTTGNDAGYSEGEQQGKGRKPGERKEEQYKEIYVPERLGGEGTESTLPGQKLDSGSSTYSEVTGAPVKKGAMVPYQEVLTQYREEAVQTMERQNIPAGMKELVKSYFSSLD